jgi:hypothetical protein
MGWVRHLIPAFVLLSGCFAYDHRWTQAQEQKQHARQRLKPATLEARGSGASELRTAKVRAYATRAYTSETLNWEARFDELLRGASAILEPALGVRLESDGVSVWQPSTPEDRMSEVLEELAQKDRGEEVSWVVGFVKSTPQLVFDHHQLGVGRLLSKYLVVRASNDPRELELLSHEYYSLSRDEVEKLHTERKRHRWLAVFLHEIGHTLGAQHRLERTTLMNPMYDPRERAFDDATLGVLRLTVGAAGSPSLDTYRTVLEFYRAHPDGWVGSDRDQMLKWLEQVARSAPPASASRSAGSASAAPREQAPAPVSPLPLSALSDGDRGHYDRALQAESKGQFKEAWQSLLPIIQANVRVLEVQDLRCRLAKTQKFFSAVEAAHCEPAEQLRVGNAR